MKDKRTYLNDSIGLNDRSQTTNKCERFEMREMFRSANIVCDSMFLQNRSFLNCRTEYFGFVANFKCPTVISS